MSAVVSAVSDVFSAVGDAVGSVVEGIGDVVETVVEDVVQPVADAVGKTIESALNDPIGTMAKVAVAVVAPELLPAVNMADSLAHGVPLDKALLNTGINMVAGNVGTDIGNVATDAFDLSCTASNLVTAGAKGAVASTMKGQNPLCGAIGSMVNNAVNAGANDLYRCIRNSSDCVPTGSANTGLPVTTSAASDDCVKGCASTTNLGGLPVVSGGNQACTVDVAANQCEDACTAGALTRGLTPTGSASNQTCGATPGALDTVNVTGSKMQCTDLACAQCTFDPNAAGDKGNILVTAKADTLCKDITCEPDNTVTVTGNRDVCCADCTPTLPPVIVTAKRDACTCVSCCDTCDECKCTPVIPKINVKTPRKTRVNTPKVKTSPIDFGVGCGAIPWLDTKDALLRNQIVPLGSKANMQDNEAKMQDIYASMHPDLAKEMQDRFGGVPQIKLNPFGEAGGLAHGGRFAGGGTSSCVSSCSFAYCYNQDAKYMPKFVDCKTDVLQSVPSSKRQQLTPKQLSQLQQHISTMGNMGGLAAGGLPKKYQDAMPKDHNPEFVTGMTGYYACGGGTGQSDDIPAMLHDGDYVMDADVVAALGDGSSKAGREVLDGFRNQIPHRETAKGKPVPAKIADGEYVFPAGFVTALGGGDNKAGAKILDGLREKLRAHKRSAPTSKIPPKAKSPLDYIKQAKG